MIKRIIYAILVISWMIFIFILSNQPAYKSSNLSNDFISNTIVNIYKIFDNNISEEKQEEIISIYTRPIRKLAHAMIYIILGILVVLLINSFDINDKKLIIISLSICILYACSDEIHQLFVLNRSCELKDIILDSLGSTIGTNIVYMLKKNKSKKVL